MASPVKAAKQQLRAVMKKRLLSIPHDSILSQSRTIFDVLRDFQPYREANRISIFLSMPSGEVQTDAIVRHALGEGKQVFIPYLYKAPLTLEGRAATPARVMDMVRLRSVQDYDSLERDAWGIPSIDPASVDERQRVFGGGAGGAGRAGDGVGAELDLVLVPGVAFDVDGERAVRRLGHGKGFYDFFLNQYLAGREEDGRLRLRFYGLSLKEQMLDGEDGEDGEEVPMGGYDRRLHGVIVGDGRVWESPDPRAISLWHPS